MTNWNIHNSILCLQKNQGVIVTLRAFNNRIEQNKSPITEASRIMSREEQIFYKGLVRMNEQGNSKEKSIEMKIFLVSRKSRIAAVLKNRSSVMKQLKWWGLGVGTSPLHRHIYTQRDTQ